MVGITNLLDEYSVLTMLIRQGTLRSLSVDTK